MPTKRRTITEGNTAVSKPLSEMTLAELWELFPIILTEHNPHWREQYALEAALLSEAMRGVEFHHIGSTAIDGIMAKPIVDRLASAPLDTDLHALAREATAMGYIVMSSSDRRISLNKGYTERGFADEVFHLHLRYSGDDDEIYFCAYLNAHADVAASYEALKLSLCEKYKHDRDGYTQAKGDFVRKYTAIARGER